MTAVSTLKAFFDADEEPSPDSAEGAYFDALITLIEAYERKHHPIAAPHDPIEAIRFHMNQTGMTIADLVPHIGMPQAVTA